MSFVVESEKTLKVKSDELENKLQEKEKELESRIIPPSTEYGEQTIVQAMSQVSLKELELVGLKNQNKNMENVALNREQERKAWEEKCQELTNKNDKLMKHVTSQSSVQGAKNIIQYSLIA